MILNLQPFTLMTGKTDHKTMKESYSSRGHSTLTHANGPPDIGTKCNAQISRSRQQPNDFPSELFSLLWPKKEALKQRLVKTNHASLIHYDSFNDRDPPTIFANDWKN